MAELNFSQASRRNLVVPIAAALLLLAGAAFLIVRETPHDTAELQVKRVTSFPVHLVYKGDSMVVGREQAQDEVYVLVTLRLTDHLRLPLFLKDFTASFVPGDGSALKTTSAVEKPDLVTVYGAFPKLKAMAEAQGPALFRETQIRPGETVEGTILLHFSILPAEWQQRRKAVINVDLYHQATLTVTLPHDGVDKP